MPYQIKWSKRGGTKRFSGHVTAAEFMLSIADTQNHPDFDIFLYTVNDFLDVTSFDVSAGDVMNYAAYGLGAQVSNSRIVVAVVANSETILKLIRDLYAPVAKFKIGYFSTDAEAQNWIRETTGYSIPA